MEVEKLGLVALASGSGSTAGTIYESTQRETRFGFLPLINFSGLITDTAEAVARNRLEKLGLPTGKMRVVNHQNYPLKARDPGFAEELLSALRSLKADVVGQYGWDVRTPKEVIDEYSDMMINQHPGPVNPDHQDFGGDNMSCATRVHAAVLMYRRATHRDFWTSVTAQSVSPLFDQGKVYKRGKVRIYESDDPDKLQARAIKVEWKTQVACLRDFQDGKTREQPPIPDLVMPGARRALELSKAVACALYTPKGDLRVEPNFESVIEKFDSSEREITKMVSYLKLAA